MISNQKLLMGTRFKAISEFSAGRSVSLRPNYLKRLASDTIFALLNMHVTVELYFFTAKTRSKNPLVEASRFVRTT
jgi:hypothetical protein